MRVGRWCGSAETDVHVPRRARWTPEPESIRRSGVDDTCQNLRLYPNKGTIAIGSDADLVIWNPLAKLSVTKSSLHQNVDYTLYEGKEIVGLPETVTLRGEVIVEGRQYVGAPGSGRFVSRKGYGVQFSGT